MQVINQIYIPGTNLETDLCFKIQPIPLSTKIGINICGMFDHFNCGRIMAMARSTVVESCRCKTAIKQWSADNPEGVLNIYARYPSTRKSCSFLVIQRKKHCTVICPCCLVTYRSYLIIDSEEIGTDPFKAPTINLPT